MFRSAKETMQKNECKRYVLASRIICFHPPVDISCSWSYLFAVLWYGGTLVSFPLSFDVVALSWKCIFCSKCIWLAIGSLI